MRRLRRRVPLTPFGWVVVIAAVGLGAAAAITGSTTLAVIVAALIAFVVLLAVGAPKNVQDLNVPPTAGPPLIPPHEDDPQD